MKILLSLLFFALFFAGYAAEKVVFDRPLKPGAVYDCIIHSEQSSRYALQMPGAENPVVKLDTVSVSLSARLTVTAVNPSGNPAGIRLELRSFSGTLNGVPVQTKPLLNQTVTGNLSKHPVTFSCVKSPLSKEASALLSAVFRPAADSRLSDMAGPDRELKEKGQVWMPSFKELCKTLEARKLAVSPKDLMGGITYSGKMELEKIQCFKFQIRIDTKQRADYDFRFNATVLLPVDPAGGPALKVTRDATEIVKRNVPRDNPFAAGADVELISKDSTDVTLIPSSSAQSLSGGSKENEWDSILR